MQHLQPGLLEQEALEWSLRRHEAAAQCKSDDAVGLSMVPVGQEGEKVKEGAAYPNEVELKKALQQSCDDYDSHHPDLEQALAISLQSLDEVAAIKDSELTVLQVYDAMDACHCIIGSEISFPNNYISSIE